MQNSIRKRAKKVPKRIKRKVKIQIFFRRILLNKPKNKLSRIFIK